MSDPSDDPSPSGSASSVLSRSASGGEPTAAVDNTNINIIFVIDESGSMSQEATVRVGSVMESTGQNNLGAVCTAVAAAQAIMPSSTASGVVMFGSHAQCLSPIVPMTDEKKANIKSSLLRRKPIGSTNLESGVKMAIDMLGEKFAKDDVKGQYIIIVLTDGQPDAERASNGENYGNFFRTYAARFQPKIYTCGFGYNVKVDLLVEISQLMGGHFSFIPTPDMVATNFINMMSHLLSQESPLVLAPEIDRHRMELIRACPEMCRLGNIGDSASALTIVRELSTRFRSTLTGMPDGESKEILIGYIKDIEGEIAMSFSDLAKNYNVWGRGYIPSLARAHELKICANYKDPGLQLYAGARFKIIQTAAAAMFRAELDDAIAKMASAPAPAAYAGGGGGGNYRYESSASARSAMYDASGGCFDGDCLVTMADGSKKPAKFIVRGDKVRSFSGEEAEVYESVKTKIIPTAEGIIFKDDFKDGLKITGWHPVFIDGKWIFPNRAPWKMVATGGTTAMCGLNIVYSFAVRAIGDSKSKLHGMEVDGIPVATLGHDVMGDEVLSHSFYGTQKVIDAIRNMREIAAKEGDNDPIVGNGVWFWAYDEKGIPVGIAKK
jgi:uncharacterized protein YegL